MYEKGKEFFDYSKYKFPSEGGNYMGILDKTRFDAKDRLLSYFTIGNGEKIMLCTFKDNDYMGLYKIPLGSCLSLDVYKAESGKVYLGKAEKIG